MQVDLLTLHARGWEGDGTFSPADTTDLSELSLRKSRCKFWSPGLALGSESFRAV